MDVDSEPARCRLRRCNQAFHPRWSGLKEKGYYVIISNPGPDKSSAEVIENSIPMAIHRIRVPQAFPIRSGMVSTLRDYEKKP